MKTLQDYVARYGPEAGPILYHTFKSRAAHMGVSTRPRHQIEALTGRRFRPRRRPAATAPKQPLLALAEPAPDAPASDLASASGSVD